MDNLLQIRKNIELMVIKKAHEDKNFEKLLLLNPKAALKELGIVLPDSVKIELIEESGDVFKFVYPSVEAGELTDASLSVVAGGTPACSTNCGGGI